MPLLYERRPELLNFLHQVIVRGGTDSWLRLSAVRGYSDEPLWTVILQRLLDDLRTHGTVAYLLKPNLMNRCILIIVLSVVTWQSTINLAVILKVTCCSCFFFFRILAPSTLTLHFGCALVTLSRNRLHQMVSMDTIHSPHSYSPSATLLVSHQSSHSLELM